MRMTIIIIVIVVIIVIMIIMMVIIMIVKSAAHDLMTQNHRDASHLPGALQFFFA